MRNDLIFISVNFRFITLNYNFKKYLIFITAIDNMQMKTRTHRNRDIIKKIHIITGKKPLA